MLLSVETHPIQYHAPIYRVLQADFQTPVTAVYGSDFSIAGHTDREFDSRVQWDTDLLGGYSHYFLSHVADGGATSADETSVQGLHGLIARLRPDAVLLSGYSPRFYRHALLAALRSRIPIIFRGETTDHALKRSRFKGALRDALLRTFYSRCDRLLFIGSRSHEHYIRLKVGEQKMIFSPYCVDTSPFRTSEEARVTMRNECRLRLSLEEHRIVILFSGKLVHRKNPEVLVAAVKHLDPGLRGRICILFLGDGPLRDSLRQLADRPPAISFIQAGFQNQSLLSSYYHASDLLVLPSLHSETWGLVVNEALHHGVPCVVSDQVGCAPDLIADSETGEIFPAGSLEGLAAALLRALKLTNRQDVRMQCRMKAQEYSLQRAAQGIAAAYSEVVHAMNPHQSTHERPAFS